MEQILEELEQIVNKEQDTMRKEYANTQIDLLEHTDTEIDKEMVKQKVKGVLCVCVETTPEAKGEAYDHNGVDMTQFGEVGTVGLAAAIGTPEAKGVLRFVTETGRMLLLHEQTDYVGLFFRMNIDTNTRISVMTSGQGMCVMTMRKGKKRVSYHLYDDIDSQKALDVSLNQIEKKHKGIPQIKDVLTAMYMSQRGPSSIKRNSPKMYAVLIEAAKIRHGDMFGEDAHKHRSPYDEDGE